MDTSDNKFHEMCLLHSRVDRSLRLHVAGHLTKFGITMMQWLLLAAVCAGPREGMTMSEVANSLAVTLPQVTALTNEMVRLNLLKQKISSKDRRSRRLQCTTAGKRLIEKIDSAMEDAYAKWLNALDEDERNNYLQTLSKLAAPPQPSL